MSKDPAVLFYTSDFLSGTAFMSMEERGQYITLLCEQHQIGRIPENHMISVCGSIDSIVIKKFIKDENGLYYNKRMEEEKLKRIKYCESRSNNKSGRPKKNHKKIINKSYDNSMIIHMENENENENENKDINRNEFNLFWDKFHLITNMSKSDKKPASEKWKRLNNAEKNKAFENIEKFYDSIDDKKYCKKAWTYLRDKNFNDEFNHKTNVFDNQDDTENNKRNRIESLGGLVL